MISRKLSNIFESIWFSLAASAAIFAVVAFTMIYNIPSANGFHAPIFTLESKHDAREGWWGQLADEFQTWDTVKEMLVKFQGPGAGLIATFEMRDGRCIQFKATEANISHARKCGEEDWTEYIWHGREDLH
jgi:hypothetical protein